MIHAGVRNLLLLFASTHLFWRSGYIFSFKRTSGSLRKKECENRKVYACEPRLLTVGGLGVNCTSPLAAVHTTLQHGGPHLQQVVCFVIELLDDM